MRPKILIPLIAALFLIFGFALAYGFRGAWVRWTIESTANRQNQNIFAGSVRVGRADLDPQLKLHLEKLGATLQTASGPVPVEILSLASEGSVLRFFSKEGLVLSFEGIRPRGSKHKGIGGKIFLKGGKKGFFILEGDVQSLDLEELRWMEPERLKGATGEIKGKVKFRQNAREAPVFSIEVHVDQPGGEVARHLFDLLVPYLPELAQTARARSQSHKEIVEFRDASLALKMEKSDQMKIFLHMRVPDYNLDLNLNIEIRIDEQNGFYRLTELMGLIKK